MNLPGFMAAGQAVVRNGLKPWAKKSFVRLKHHELMAAASMEAWPTIFGLFYE
jgi:hypothetical protein